MARFLSTLLGAPARRAGGAGRSAEGERWRFGRCGAHFALGAVKDEGVHEEACLTLLLARAGAYLTAGEELGKEEPDIKVKATRSCAKEGRKPKQLPKPCL